MGQFVRVGSTADFEDLPGGKSIEVGGRSIAIFKHDGTYFAVENECPHKGGFLAEGIVEGDEVICPLHAARFNLRTGAVTAPPARQGVQTFPVRVTGNDVEIEVE